ncbi:MAG TPA: hypothetical protein VFI20_10610, partial [Terracidiphilus sp.]|nr:hypothetical protein [Terracidiphilus sp.]
VRAATSIASFPPAWGRSGVGMKIVILPLFAYFNLMLQPAKWIAPWLPALPERRLKVASSLIFILMIPWEIENSVRNHREAGC